MTSALMTYIQRQQTIIRSVALKAHRQPLLDCGLWFLHDVRDNFYYASYLCAAAVDRTLELPFDREAAKSTAESVLLEVLRLQNQDPASELYGHWPLQLRPTPQTAAPHVLPAELMGSLMIYFCERYSHHFEEPLRSAFETAFQHLYGSTYYRMPMELYNHHEAKYTASKLIIGQRFADAALLADGHRSLLLTLERVQKYGMTEYGALPWFWHWVQAFTCAWELAEDPAIKSDLGRMLDWLWNERAQFYLKGTWVGAHSRGWPHDIPRDANVLFDYVQFGDFELPEEMPRTEYAGFLFYEAPEQARRTALQRGEPVEVAKSVPLSAAEPETRLHSYVYITGQFAAGGIWERRREFDNEQHRWDVTLPLTSGAAGVNQAYFFHPEDGNADNDPRHQSDSAEVLLHRNAIVSLYPIPEDAPARIVGVLPNGVWLQEERALFGCSGDVLFAVYLMQPYKAEEKEDRLAIVSEGRTNGVVVEVIGSGDAERMGIGSGDAVRKGIGGVEAFAAMMRERAPVFSGWEAPSARYTTVSGGDTLELAVRPEGGADARINGNPVDFGGYEV